MDSRFSEEEDDAQSSCTRDMLNKRSMLMKVNIDKLSEKELIELNNKRKKLVGRNTKSNLTIY